MDPLGRGFTRVRGLGIQFVIRERFGDGKPRSIDIQHAPVVADDVLLVVDWEAAGPCRRHWGGYASVTGWLVVRTLGTDQALLELDAPVAGLVRGMMNHGGKVHFDALVEDVVEFGECVR